MSFFGSIYFIVFIILMMFSLITIDIRGKKFTNIFLLFSFLILTMLAGLRKGSPDQQSYALIFKNAPTLFDYIPPGNNYESSNVEVGFIFLLSIIKTVTSNEVVMFFSLASIVLGTVVYASKRLSPYPLLSVLIYFSWFYYMNLGALRHALISSLLLLIIVFLVKNRKIKAFIGFIISFFIHKIGVVLPILYLIIKFDMKPILYVALITFSLIVALYGGLFLFSFDLLSDYTPENWHDSLDSYISLTKSGGFDTGFGGKENILKGSSLKQLFIVSVSLFYFSILKIKFQKSFKIVFGIYLLSLVSMLLLIDFKIVSDRVSNYLAITEILLLPMILSIMDVRLRVVALITIFSLMLIQLYLIYGNQLYVYKY
jgi:hypothetical protein